MKIVVLNGSAGVGKDTFVNLVYNLKGGVGVKSISTVDIPKQMAQDYFYWNPEKKTDKDRKLLSDLKDLMTWYDDLILKDVVNYVCLNKNTGLIDILFIHCREPEEIDKLVSELKWRENIEVCCTVLIEASNRISHTPNNHADQNVYDYSYDYYIENNGTIEDLIEAAKLFLEDIS